MLRGQEQKNGQRMSPPAATRAPKLSMNLHTMPQTVDSHWKKWLGLGFLVLGIFALILLIFYSLSS
jgi:hypothetical protein